MMNSIPLKVFKSLIVDRSGSMYTMGDKPSEMTHKFLHDTVSQSLSENVSTLTSFITFDDIVEDVFKNKNLTVDDIPSLQSIRHSLHPRGGTKFNDTIIEELDYLMKQKNDYYNSLPRIVKNLDPNITTIAILITDGMDNSSHNSIEKCHEKIKEFYDSGGKIILMTANIDSQSIGENYGINLDNCITVHNSDPDAIEAGFNAVTCTQRQFSSGIRNAQFTPLERDQSQGLFHTTNENTLEESDEQHLLQPMSISNLLQQQSQHFTFDDLY